jgi:nitroreductase
MTSGTTSAARAASDAALHPLLADRWSPRAFDPDAELDAPLLERLLEAARWSPSAANLQPWRFAVAVRGSAEHAALVATLSGNNAVWAPDASVLLLVAADHSVAGGRGRRWAAFDAGQALAHLTVQAAAEGVAVHTMGGFDVDAVRALYALGADVDPLAVVALGRQGDAGRLPEPLREREGALRERRPLPELLLAPLGKGTGEDTGEDTAA